MDALGPFHPAIVHTPIALIIVSAVFELAGHALDREWLRRAAFAMLVVGVLGAGLAVLSGHGAEEAVEHQGVAKEAIHEHEEVAQFAWWLGLAAVVSRAVAGRVGAARAAVAGLALLLHLAAAVTVGIAGYRGGVLVFEHGAGVQAVRAPIDGERGGDRARSEEAREHGRESERGH